MQSIFSWFWFWFKINFKKMILIGWKSYLRNWFWFDFKSYLKWSLWLGEAVGKLCRSISGPAWLLRWAVGPITVNYQKILHTEPTFCQNLSFKAIKTRIQAHGRNRTYFFKLELYFFETILKGVPVRHQSQRYEWSEHT